jgi:hypothetical protein
MTVLRFGLESAVSVSEIYVLTIIEAGILVNQQTFFLNTIESDDHLFLSQILFHVPLFLDQF